MEGRPAGQPSDQITVPRIGDKWADARRTPLDGPPRGRGAWLVPPRRVAVLPARREQRLPGARDRGASSCSSAGRAASGHRRGPRARRHAGDPRPVPSEELAAIPGCAARPPAGRVVPERRRARSCPRGALRRVRHTRFSATSSSSSRRPRPTRRARLGPRGDVDLAIVMDFEDTPLLAPDRSSPSCSTTSYDGPPRDHRLAGRARSTSVTSRRNAGWCRRAGDRLSRRGSSARVASTDSSRASRIETDENEQRRRSSPPASAWRSSAPRADRAARRRCAVRGPWSAPGRDHAWRLRRVCAGHADRTPHRSPVGRGDDRDPARRGRRVRARRGVP